MKGGGGMRERVVLVTALVAAWVAGIASVARGAWATPVGLAASLWVWFSVANLLIHRRG